MNQIIKRCFFLWALAAICVIRVAAQGEQTFAADQKLLASYHSELQKLRLVRPSFGMPDLSFFLFGMGARPKYIYVSGKLMAWPSGQVLRKWNVQRETIVPPSYSVWLSTAKGTVHIFESESGLFLVEKGQRSVLSEEHVSLPAFEGERLPLVLRVLHQEILINILNGRPVPNFLVYSKPWYRDAAMMAMVLQRTGNTGLIREWVMSLRDPFDHNNAGNSEPDNLGEVLFLISCVSDRNHPLVGQTLKAVDAFRKDNYIVGMTDFAEHPVYQTKWLKFGLKSLGLPDDSLKIPRAKDSYASLFWWAFRDDQIGREFSGAGATNYPYLAWARDHLTGGHTGPVSSAFYPLSWEAEASQANYAGESAIFPDFASRRLAAPHSWHAAEMFLLLADKR